MAKNDAAPLAPSRDVWQPFDSKRDPLAAWMTMNRTMTENPRLLKAIAARSKNFASIRRDVAGAVDDGVPHRRLSNRATSIEMLINLPDCFREYVYNALLRRGRGYL